ncbi:membrane protein insertase YidC [Terriglobus albidus]|uniref:membrane protein insertase YidC n=1 Tax=Terriglobus albidus TaxID=1592106 RepID=UPI0021DFAB9B|nr:membrane protein insertase YidC [Terriglobus albidus]
MAEFKNPRQDNGVRLYIVLVFIAAMFFSFQRRPAPITQRQQAPDNKRTEEVASPAPVSMNLVEQELFIVLAFVQSHVAAGWDGSWGWAIVLLTGGVNLLILPLRISSMRSGFKMRRIQPEIENIKARYKGVKLTDPRHNDMAAEIAKLQKDNGIHVFGGCIPLLLQMPLLFAFFGMLRKAAALHGAGWLWLHDLSSADPYHILPILMVVFQLLMQWYTPSPGVDAKQQKTMACLMTIGFGYVSWHYASGLALYALTGSIFSIATQAVINLSPLGKEMGGLPAGSVG